MNNKIRMMHSIEPGVSRCVCVFCDVWPWRRSSHFLSCALGDVVVMATTAASRLIGWQAEEERGCRRVCVCVCVRWADNIPEINGALWCGWHTCSISVLLYSSVISYEESQSFTSAASADLSWPHTFDFYLLQTEDEQTSDNVRSGPRLRNRKKIQGHTAVTTHTHTLQASGIHQQSTEETVWEYCW